MTPRPPTTVAERLRAHYDLPHPCCGVLEADKRSLLREAAEKIDPKENDNGCE